MLEEIFISPASVDISSGSQTILVTMRITDSDVGFSFGEISINGPSGQRLNTFFSSGSEISGNDFDGVHEVIVTIPQFAEPGSWTLNVNLSDYDNNSADYFGSDFVGSEFITVANTDTADTQAPTITSFQVSTNAVDPSSAPVSVTVDISLADSPSGLEESYFYLYDPAGNYLSGSLVSLTSGNRTSGDAFSGTYQFDLTFPTGAANGIWTIRSFTRDSAGNSVLNGFSGPSMPGPDSAQITVGPIGNSTYGAFALANSLSGNNALPASNPDFDWANNALELLLGLDPNVVNLPNPSLYKITRIGNELQLDFKVAAGLTATVDGDFLSLSDGGGGAPFRVTGQTNSTLAETWTNTLPVSLGGGYYRVSLPIVPGINGFCRLMFEGS